MRRPALQPRAAPGRVRRGGHPQNSSVVFLLYSLEIRHESTFGAGNDLHQFPALGTPIVEDGCRVVNDERSRHVFPDWHLSALVQGRFATIAYPVSYVCPNSAARPS